MGLDTQTRFHPTLDAVPDPSDDRFYYCECGYFCPRSNRDQWQAHLDDTDHIRHPLNTEDVPVHAVGAVPLPDQPTVTPKKRGRPRRVLR